MTDDDLREAIRVRERKQLELSAARMAEAVDRLEADGGDGSNLRSLHQDATLREQLVEQKVEELLPHLKAVREEEEATGPVTDDQIYVASMRRGQNQLGNMADLMLEKARTMPPGRRRTIVEMLAQNVLLDNEEFGRLSTDPTQEGLQRTTSTISDRMKALAEYVRQTRGQT